MPRSDEVEALRREILAKISESQSRNAAATNQAIAGINILLERASIQADHARKVADNLRPRVLELEKYSAKSEGRGEATQQILTSRTEERKAQQDFDLKRMTAWQKFLLAVAGVVLPFLGAAADRVLAMLAGGNP